MKFLYDLAGGQSDTQKINVFNNGTTPVKVGAAVMKGVTAATNNVMAIVATGTLADIIGVLEAASSATDASMTATPVNNFVKACVNPFAVYLAEYSQASADLVTATSASSTTAINCTSIEAMAGGWLYTVVGTGLGQLNYIVSQAGGANTLTAKSAPTVAYDTTTKFLKVLPKLWETIALSGDATKLASAAAAGSGAGRVIENYMRYDGRPLVALDPTLHDALVGLNSLNAHFYSAIVFLDHAFNIGA